MRLSFRENIRTLIPCTARDHVDLPTVTIFQLDVVPELVEHDQKKLRAGVDVLRSSKNVRSLIVFKDQTVDSCNQFLRALDDIRHFEQKFANDINARIDDASAEYSASKVLREISVWRCDWDSMHRRGSV
jgi:hypothetical protein